MQALVPKEYLFGKGKHSSDESPEAGMGGEGECGEGGKESKEDAAAKSNSSKASTVESANVYIRNMQRRQVEEAAENEVLRRRVEEMERRLTEREGGGTGGGVGGGPDAAPSAVDAAVTASTEMVVDEQAAESGSPELVKAS